MTHPSAATHTRKLAVDAVAFDFDGTLADTTPVIVATALQTLAELGLSTVEPQLFVRMIGLPLKQAFLGVGVNAQHADACVVRYRERFPQHAERVRLQPGAEECLRALSEADIPMGIVSSRGRTSLLQLLDQLRIAHHFAVVLGDEDAFAKKPEPELVLTFAQRLQLSPRRVLVVGDTTYDIEMGNAAGALTCAVQGGCHDVTQLRSARPTHHLDSLANLGALLLS